MTGMPAGIGYLSVHNIPEAVIFPTPTRMPATKFSLRRKPYT
jgi:hypothetical protein